MRGFRGRSFVAAVAVLVMATAVFFIFGAAASGLYRLFDGSFFTPENLLAWQIPALRGIEVRLDGEGLDGEPLAPIAAPEGEPGVVREEVLKGADGSAGSAGAAGSAGTAGSAGSAGAKGATDSDASPAPSSKVEVVQINPAVSDEVKIEIMSMENEKLPSIDLSGKEPRVLIYSTHSSEAYTQTDENEYEPSSEWRTHDESKNIIAVGAALAKELRERYGVAVVHDTTDHEPPDFYTSYSRSLDTMQKYKERYPTIDVFIDIHRDADTSKRENTDFVEIDGKRVSRLMFVVGTGQGVTGVGWKERPEWKQNYQLALDITKELNDICPTFGKPVRINTGRYNQHFSSRAMLIEVGHNKNTLEESLNAMPYLARAIAQATGQAGDD